MHKILIADDEVIERTLLERKLTKAFEQECKIISVGNGKEVLEADTAHQPDIMILDIEMPVISGLEAAKKLRSQGRDCPIILLTAYDEFHYTKQAISVHALDYLLKPCDEKELYLAVEEAIRSVDSKAVKESKGLDSMDAATENNNSSMEKHGIPSEKEQTVEEDHEGNQVKLLSYIYDHYMEDISVHDLSTYMGYSEVHTCRLFKQYFGQTFVSYLAHYRMRKAAHLLLYTDMNVREIGKAVGYANSNYFGKVFHRIYEMTPTEYREREKK